MQPVKPDLDVTLGEEVIIAKAQPPYLPLIAHMYRGTVAAAPVVTRWRFTLRERIAILFGRDLYHQVLTFGQPYPPMKMSLDRDHVRYMTDDERRFKLAPKTYGK